MIELGEERYVHLRPQWKNGAERRDLYAGNCAETFKGAANKWLDNALLVRVPVVEVRSCVEHNAARQHVLLGEPKWHLAQRMNSAQEETCSHEEYQRKGELPNNKYLASAIGACR